MESFISYKSNNTEDRKVEFLHISTIEMNLEEEEEEDSMFNNIINIFSDPDNDSIINSMVIGADITDIEIIKHLLILFSLCINGNLNQETII